MRKEYISPFGTGNTVRGVVTCALICNNRLFKIVTAIFFFIETICFITAEPQVVSSVSELLQYHTPDIYITPAVMQ